MKLLQLFESVTFPDIKIDNRLVNAMLDFTNKTMDEYEEYKNAEGRDGRDYYHAAKRSASAIRRCGSYDEVRKWLAQPIGKWNASDGDPRFALEGILTQWNRAEDAAKWKQYLESLY